MFTFYFFAITAVCSVQAFYFFGHEYNRTVLGDAIDKTSLKLLKEAYTSGQDKNVVTSPLGVMLLLSLYSAGAGEGTREETIKLLGGGDYSQLVSSYSGLSKSFSEMNPDFLTVANKIYVGDKYTLNEGFTRTARQYESEVETIDFKDTKKATDIINKWANEKTKGHINSPIAEDTIDPTAAAALFNVIFFQGHWHVPFNANETEDKDFHVDSETIVKKPTMRLVQTLFYTENKELGARFIELPYKESGFRMVVVLPEKLDGLPSVLEKAAEKGLLDDVFRLQPARRDVNLEIPKFEVKSGLDLNNLLPKIGVSKIFDEPAPEIVKGDSVTVSKAFQEAFIKVDEEGATAGAFTGIVAVPTSSISRPPPPMDYKVDHPFAYLILHEDKIIFAGTYTH